MMQWVSIQTQELALPIEYIGVKLDALNRWSERPPPGTSK